MKIGEWVKPDPSKLHPEIVLKYGHYRGIIIGYAWKEDDPAYRPTYAQVLWEAGSGFTLHWTLKNLVPCDEVPFKFSVSPKTITEENEIISYYQRVIGDITEEDFPPEDSADCPCGHGSIDACDQCQETGIGSPLVSG